MFFHVFFCNIIKVNHFLCRFIILLYLISSFLLTRPWLVLYAYVSFESIDCILLSTFELKVAATDMRTFYKGVSSLGS